MINGEVAAAVMVMDALGECCFVSPRNVSLVEAVVRGQRGRRAYNIRWDMSWILNGSGVLGLRVHATRDSSPCQSGRQRMRTQSV